MRRLAAILFFPPALVAMGAAVAGPAWASPPLPPPPVPISTSTFTLPGTNTDGPNGFCSFEVTVTVTGKAHYRQSTLDDGTVITKAEGSLRAIVKNDDPGGKSLSYNVSGPGTSTQYAVNGTLDGSFAVDAHGPNLLWTTVANSFPGVPQLAYTDGHVVFSVLASGLTDSYHLDGKSVDVCAALAP